MDRYERMSIKDRIRHARRAGTTFEVYKLPDGTIRVMLCQQWKRVERPAVEYLVGTYTHTVRIEDVMADIESEGGEV